MREPEAESGWRQKQKTFEDVKGGRGEYAELLRNEVGIGVIGKFLRYV